MNKLLLCLLLLVVVSSCGLTKDDDAVQQARIADIIQRIMDAFNRNDEVDKIMSYYHRDFLHDGLNDDYARHWWRGKRVENSMIESVSGQRSIEIDGSYARAVLVINFINLENMQIPYPGYIMSYFYHERGEWKIYGNQKRGGERDE